MRISAALTLSCTPLRPGLGHPQTSHISDIHCTPPAPGARFSVLPTSLPGAMHRRRNPSAMLLPLYSLCNMRLSRVGAKALCPLGACLERLGERVYIILVSGVMHAGDHYLPLAVGTYTLAQYHQIILFSLPADSTLSHNNTSHRKYNYPLTEQLFPLCCILFLTAKACEGKRQKKIVFCWDI